MNPDAGDGFVVRSLAITYRDGHRLSTHAHPWAQLVYATSGLMRVQADDRVWFVPPTRAVWLPPEVDHAIDFTGEVALRTLYLAPALAMQAARALETLEVTPLLRELILHIQRIGMLDPDVTQHEHLACILVDLVADAQPLDTALPRPFDERARRLAEHVAGNPSDRSDLRQLAARYGASLRTMQRNFSTETRFTLDAWRQRARLLHASARLSDGASVADTALASGYESTSAFGAAFRRQFGVTPGRFRAARRSPSVRKTDPA